MKGDRVKKILVVLGSILLGTTFSSAQKTTEKIQKEVQAVVEFNAGVEESNRTLEFVLEETVRHVPTGAEGTYHADYRCKAYALDEHWYILAGTCGNSVAGDVGHDDADDYTHHNLTLKSIRFEDITYYKNKHLMLLREEKFIPGLYVKVLATSSPKQLFALTSNDYTAKINSSRFGLNIVKTREPKPKTILGNSFSLREGLFHLQGTATDPLFLVASNEESFLAAYNKAPMVYYFYDNPNQVRGSTQPKGERSIFWYSLTKDDLQFIKTTVQKYPGDWERIKNRLFLDETQTPYFD